MISRILNWLYDRIDALKQRQVDRVYREDQMGPMLAREARLMIEERGAAAPMVERERKRIHMLIAIGYARNERARRRIRRWALAGKLPRAGEDLIGSVRPGPFS